MSYLVLARKYRPQTFEQVIGQEHVTRTLQNAIQRGRIHHAFLFCGGRGTGKTTTARILAKALSCVNAPTPTPCNECPACVEITNGTSVDVQEIDAASQNRVEDIRDLREAIRYAPVRGKKKLYILDEVHMLSTSAFNALLKTLEEPPPHAVFVFATTDPHKLPQTILSRVQRYDFKLVPTAKLVEHLADVLTREQIEFERSALQLVAREGAGSVRDSLSLLDQVLASTQGRLTEEQAAAVLGVADRGLILGLGRAIVGRDAARALALVDDAYQRGFDLAQLARTLLGHLRDLVVVSVVKDPEPLLDATGAELDELRAQAEHAAGRAELLFDRMVRVADETSRAALARYVLEVGLVELCAVAPLQPIGELLERLEQLEDRLAGRAPARAGGRSGGPPTGGSVGGGPGASGGPSGPVPTSGAARFAGPATAPAAELHRPAPGAAVATPAAGERLAASAPPAPQSVRPSPPAPTVPTRVAVAPQLHVEPAVPQVIEHSPRPVLPPEPAPPATMPAPSQAAAAVGPEGAATPVPASRAAAPADVASVVGPAAAPAVVSPGAAVPTTAAPAVASVALVESVSVESVSVETASASAPPQVAERFTLLMKSVIEKAPLLGFLESARALAFTEKRIVLGFNKAFFVDEAQRKRDQIRAAIEAELRITIEVAIELVTTGPDDVSPLESLAEAQSRARAAATEKLRREAAGHGSLKLIKEVFGAAVSFSEPVLEELSHV